MRIVVLAAALCCFSVPARSQAPDVAPTAWASGMSVGLPGGIGERTSPVLLTVGGNFTRLGKGAGPEISLFTVPIVIRYGGLPVLGRFGVGRPIMLDSTGNSYFVPSVGLVGAGIITENGGGVIGGWYTGLAMLVFTNGKNGVRFAYNLHGLTLPAAWHLEVGLVRR